MIYVCIMDYGDKADIERVRPRHQAYQFKLIDEGTVIAAGSLLQPDDGGLFLYETPSLEVAQRLVDNDPYIREGCIPRYRLRKYEIHGANASLLRATDP
jgi:uncharacterized protein YciI